MWSPLRLLQSRHAYSQYNWHAHAVSQTLGKADSVQYGNHNAQILNRPMVRHAHLLPRHGHVHHVNRSATRHHVDGSFHIHGYAPASHTGLDGYYKKLP